MHDALKGDKGLVVGDPAQRHAVSTTFKALDPKGSGFVVQYELQLKNGPHSRRAALQSVLAGHGKPPGPLDELLRGRRPSDSPRAAPTTHRPSRLQAWSAAVLTSSC